MTANIKLLSAIRENEMRQKDFAKAVGDHPTFISRVVNGWINLDEKRKAKYAKALAKDPGELFK